MQSLKMAKALIDRQLAIYSPFSLEDNSRETTACLTLATEHESSCQPSHAYFVESWTSSGATCTNIRLDRV
jgi:hypothetical protein